MAARGPRLGQKKRAVPEIARPLSGGRLRDGYMASLGLTRTILGAAERPNPQAARSSIHLRTLVANHAGPSALRAAGIVGARRHATHRHHQNHDGQPCGWDQDEEHCDLSRTTKEGAAPGEDGTAPIRREECRVARLAPTRTILGVGEQANPQAARSSITQLPATAQAAEKGPRDRGR